MDLIQFLILLCRIIHESHGIFHAFIGIIKSYIHSCDGVSSVLRHDEFTSIALL